MSEDEGAEAAVDEESADVTEEPADADDGETAGDVEESDAPDADLVERVADADPEQVAREITSLRERADDAEAATVEYEERVEELESSLKRSKADFQNYKKRMQRRREQEQQRATEDLVGRLLDVRDNLVRALDQDEGVDIRDGVETTLRQFDRVFEEENVAAIEPEPGAETDPQRHEVLMRVESDQPAGTVDQVHRPGYEMAEKVLRPAQVTVSEGSDGTDEQTDDEE